MKKLSLCLALAALAALGTARLNAQAFAINPDESDAEITNTNTIGSTPTVTDGMDYQARIGEYYSPGGSEYVMPFQLPTLSPGSVITSANLQTQLFALGDENSGLANADLYAIGTVATPTVTATANILSSYYYQGPLDPSNDLLQSGYLTPSSTVRTDANTGPFTETSLTGQAGLVAFLNAAENGGANAGKYVYLRISYDAATIPAGNNFYAVLTDDAGGTYEKPILTVTEGSQSLPVSVPEPSSYAMISAGLVLLAIVLRRRGARA